MWSSQQTSYTEDLPCRFVSMNLSHRENWDNTEKAEVQCISEAFTPQPNSIKVTFHRERLNISPRQSSLPEEVQLFNQSISAKRLMCPLGMKYTNGLKKDQAKWTWTESSRHREQPLLVIKTETWKQAQQAQAFTYLPFTGRMVWLASGELVRAWPATRQFSQLLS